MPRRSSSPAGVGRQPSRSNASYWRGVHQRFESDEQFKEAVSKDHEIVSAAGALIMAIAFAGLTQTPYEQHDSLSMRSAMKSAGKAEEEVQQYESWQLVLRFSYVTFTMLAVGCSSFATLTSMRTGLMLTLHPATATVGLLEALSVARDERKMVPGRTLHPWRALKYSVIFLLCAVCIYVLCVYSMIEFSVSLLVLGLTLHLWDAEDSVHSRVQDPDEIARRSKQS